MLAFVVAVIGPDSDTAGATDDAGIDPIGMLVPDDALDPRVLGLELSGAAWRAAVDRLDAALFAQAENDREISTTGDLLATLSAEQAALEGSLRELARRQADAAAELVFVEAILQARALERYVHFGDDPLAALDDPEVATDQGRAEDLARRVDEVQFSTRQDLLDQIAGAADQQRAKQTRLVEVELALASTWSRQVDAVVRREGLTDEVVAATTAVRHARRAARVPGYDFSVVALDGYLNAERLLGANWPSCGARWWMIAGVARIESRHGQIGGRALQAAGRPSRPIIGIALDGGPGVRAMHDTDDGRLDGDSTWDRAVGPLQFIPETWAHRGRDGSGDGVADPQNIYDAAYSAGRYLCAIGGDLTSRSNLRSAYFGYNNSSAYVDAVIGWADRYAALVLPTPTA